MRLSSIEAVFHLGRLPLMAELANYRNYTEKAIIIMIVKVLVTFSEIKPILYEVVMHYTHTLLYRLTVIDDLSSPRSSKRSFSTDLPINLAGLSSMGGMGGDPTPSRACPPP